MLESYLPLLGKGMGGGRGWAPPSSPTAWRDGSGPYKTPLPWRGGGPLPTQGLGEKFLVGPADLALRVKGRGPAVPGPGPLQIPQPVPAQAQLQAGVVPAALGPGEPALRAVQGCPVPEGRPPATGRGGSTSPPSWQQSSGRGTPIPTRALVRASRARPSSPRDCQPRLRSKQAWRRSSSQPLAAQQKPLQSPGPPPWACPGPATPGRSRNCSLGVSHPRCPRTFSRIPQVPPWVSGLCLLVGDGGVPPHHLAPGGDGLVHRPLPAKAPLPPEKPLPPVGEGRPAPSRPGRRGRGASPRPCRERGSPSAAGTSRRSSGRSTSSASSHRQ